MGNSKPARIQRGQGNPGTLTFVPDSLVVPDRDGVEVQRGRRRGVQAHFVLKTPKGQSMGMTRHVEQLTPSRGSSPVLAKVV